MSSRACLLLCALMPLAGRTSRVSAQDTATARPLPGRPDANLITRDQFNASALRTAWDVVESIHPNWLRQRPGSRSSGTLTRPAGTDTSATGRTASALPFAEPPRRDTDTPGAAPTGIQVWLDGMRLGELEELRNVAAAQVYSIRRFSGSEARFRFGSAQAGGVLYVLTRPEGERR